MATAVNINATNNAEIDGLLAGVKWSGSITYSFPDSPSDYPSSGYSQDNEPAQTGFASAPAAMQAAINYAINLIKGYTNISISYAGTNSADIQIAQSPAANPTSYAYYPGSYAAGGDIWFGTSYNYSGAKLGNYLFATALHELGHSLGLKHSQETGGVANVAVPSAHDDSEYTIMSYRSYVGAPLTGYTAEQYGFSQTYMANDIVALQTLYGANYNTQSGNTVYSWSATTGQMFINGAAQLPPGDGNGGSANRIFETIWDGGGVDTYDLSNYTTSVSINLNPGAWTTTSQAQLAYLGNGHYAAGNILNAYLYNNDARSYIDNAIGGSAGDTIVGNAIANNLNGGDGNDTITGGGGNDTIIGGSGTDTAVYSGARANYLITYNSATQTFTIADQRSGSPDGTDTVTGVENFQFTDGAYASSQFTTTAPPVVIESVGNTSLVQVGSNYYLNPAAGGTGPVLSIKGAAVVPGQYNGYLPFAAEATSSGYVVAFKDTASGQFSIWNVDSSGAYVSNIVGIAAGSSSDVQSQESAFHQDLNGDGFIGVPSASPPPPPPSPAGTVIESVGNTDLVQVGNNYYLNPAAGGTGPVLSIKGAAVVPGQYNGYLPFAAEATSSGYVVAFKDTASGQFSIWNVDSSGAYVSNIVGIAAGNSSDVQSQEPAFHQDLNGDGVIGTQSATSPPPPPPPPPTGTVIESVGNTSLVQVGNNYYLNPAAGGTGPVLSIKGAAVVPGQYNGYLPFAAEATSSGYVVAFKDTASGQFSIWNVDSSGAYVSNIVGIAAGSSSEVKSQEPAFHQDLNGDGVIGASSAPLASSMPAGEGPDAFPVWLDQGAQQLFSANGNGFVFAQNFGTDIAGHGATPPSGSHDGFSLGHLIGLENAGDSLSHLVTPVAPVETVPAVEPLLHLKDFFLT